MYVILPRCNITEKEKLVTNRDKKQSYLIFSVDTEHDTVGNHNTRTAGWTKGNSLLFESLDTLGMKGKVCWLIEYNIKEGIPAANPNSEYYVQELNELIEQIKARGDELGIHPTMSDYIGSEKQISVASYNNKDLWDAERAYHDSEFVLDLITSAVKEMKSVSGVDPIGCRTGGCQYATGLANALEKNGVIVDSSVLRSRKQFVNSPNAYYASGDDIRRKSTLNAGVLEIPTVSFMELNIRKPLTRIRTEYLLHLRKPVFLSLLIHNWQAITADGEKNECFLENLNSFFSSLRNRGVCFLSWIEAKATFDSIYVTE